MGGSVLKPFKSFKQLFRKPHTIKYPYQEHKDMLGKQLPTERYRGMHSNDIEKCIGCQMCGRICMNNAISYVEVPELEGINNGRALRPVIDYGRCCYCGLCTDICPTKSLKLTTKYEYISKDIKTFKSIPTKKLEELSSVALREQDLIFTKGELVEKLALNKKKKNDEEKKEE